MQQKDHFTRADTLRGTLSPLRSCYDVTFYGLDVDVNVADSSLTGSVEFRYKTVADFTELQIDLFAQMKVEKILFHGKELPYKREFNAVFVTFPEQQKKGSENGFTVYYSGKPNVAKNAPWDGGFDFAKDENGKPWIATAVQGHGASSWWPCKDHQSDEPDSMRIRVTVPEGLMDVSNGRLISTEKKGGKNTFTWYVSSPINNYCVALNIGDYAHLPQQHYKGLDGDLTLDYYVLKGHEKEAEAQFDRNVKPMLAAFEDWFGPYAFYKDGYKLVETPHLGMEHQSAVAYGNKFKNGYRGRDLSGTGWGEKFDFIIIHESGHEWFGNNITSKDVADMWIHEGFTAYSEPLFIEHQFGKKAGFEYIAGIRKNIQNDKPIIGPYGVNKEGSGDMYYKGSNMLHTIRLIINDDAKWKSILRGLNKTFRWKTVTTEDILGYMNKASGKNLKPVFDAYLRHVEAPKFSYQLKNGKLYYQLISPVKELVLPVTIKSGAKTLRLEATTSEKSMAAAGPVTVDPLGVYVLPEEKSK
ncbi:MAG: M1 family metallopeptidase [Mucilaginibacter polytrichastri]|nr:M1 family metallopeptidase [Mucilaginibacter polytrichastri]